MRFLSTLSLLLSPLASATTSLLPLYIYPYPATLWQPVYDAVAAYPTVSFTIIINSDSGPNSSTPNSDYAPTVAKLNNYSNARLIGYVHTLYAAESTSAVEANITDWAGWNTYAEQAGNLNTTISGIFFDEATNDADSDHESYLCNLATFARSALQSSADPTPFVVYNPGATVPSAYFTGNVDLIVQFENPFANYNPATSGGTVAGFASDMVPKSAIIAYSTASAGAGTVMADTKSAASQGVGGVYFAADATYQDLSLLQDVAAGLA